MANFDPTDVPGYPFGTGDPVPHAAPNKLAENQAKTINAAEGSSHAPSADIELSGAGGGGFSFDTGNPFPFKGSLDVTAGLLCTAPIAGSVIFDKLVAVDMRGPLTFKASPGGAPGSAQFETGCTCTFASGSTLTCASGCTVNLTGSTLVRGTLTIKSSGGPGHVVAESGTDITINTGALQYIYGEQRVVSGGALTAFSGSTTTLSGAVNSNGTFTHTSSTKPALSPARTWHRRAHLIAGASIDTGVPQGMNAISPLFTAPTIYGLGGSSSPVILYVMFMPPHGGKITAVSVVSVIATNPAGTITRATYELVRWGSSLGAAATSMSDIVNDAHLANGSDWSTVKTTTLTGIDSATAIDLTNGYGLRITSGEVSGVALAMFYDVLVTGTIDELNGQ